MPKTEKTRKKPGTPAGRGRKKATLYHDAAVNAFTAILDEITEDGDVTLEHEHQLSKQSMRIDMLLKKERDVEIKRVWGSFMRKYNIIEYKSPVVPLPTLDVFNKVVHGYAGVYASQENISLTDMTVTIVCAEKPETLLTTLEKELNYEILRGDAGIYYINLKSVPIEKMLAVQIVVCSELPDSEILLKALTPGIDEDTARKVSDIIDADVADKLSIWTEVVLKENTNTILKEDDNMGKAEFVRALKKHGYYDLWVAEGRQEGRQVGLQEGLQEGRQVGLQEGRQVGLQEGRQVGLQEGRQVGLQEGRQEGEQEGWQKGLEEEKRRTARAMLADGMDVNTIARITGLTVGEIAKL